jgi:L-malate glycosyltransferase
MISAVAINGAALHGILLAKYLRARGHQVLLLSRPGAWDDAQFALDGIERLLTSFGRQPRELIRVAKVVRDFNPDVIHTHLSSAHTYGALSRLFGTAPVVATAQVAHVQLHWPFNHRVIAASQQVADYHRRYNLVPARAIQVLPNFIDTGRLRPANAAERAAARAQFAIADAAFVVGSVGHLHEYKRPGDLLRAFAHLAAVNDKARLLVVGFASAAMLEPMHSLANQLGIAQRVVFAGQRPDATDLLAAMDVFALASGREAGPLAILEAMARGLPVVATRVGMVPELVLDGSTGLLADVGDTETLGRYLMSLAADDERRTRFALAGRRHVEENYSVEAVAPKIEAVLAEASAIAHRPLLGFIARRFVGPPKPRDAAASAGRDGASG